MADELCQLHEFISTKNKQHKIQYTHLNPNGPHTLIFCYGAGGLAIDATRYRSFITSYPELSLLCIDRWTLPATEDAEGTSVARSGPSLIAELTAITIELLDSLNVDAFSIAAHSAGAYQMLDLARTCEKGRVKNIFPITTHIPASFLSSTAMNFMCKAPDFLFNTITQMDAKAGNSVVGRFAAKMLTPKGGNDHDNDGTFVDTPKVRRLLAGYEPTAEQRALDEERASLDYRLVYTRLPDIPMDVLVELWMSLKSRPGTPVTWFTCEADVFFGPSGVRKVMEALKPERDDVEMIVVDGANHADIFRRMSVWEEMFRRMTAGERGSVYLTEIEAKNCHVQVRGDELK